jgi:hypothetical protein
MTNTIASGSPKVIPFDDEFRRIQEISTAILGEAFGATLDQRQFQSALFALLEPEFDRIVKEGNFADQLGTTEARQQFMRDTIDRNTKLGEQAASLSARLTESVGNLGTLTDSDRELISSAISGARAVGQKQIDDFVSGNFLSANEVAAARGLSPTDAPVGNIRGRIAEEAISQKGLLESQLATQQAELSLNLPMQRLALEGQVAGQVGSLAQGASAFQAALAQNAEANRLNLVGTTAQAGLGLTGLAATGPGTLTGSRPVVGQKTSQISISTRMLKTNEREVNSTEVLARLQTLPIKAWEYLWDKGEEAFQVGPYAEDFQKAFGGDSYRINLLHALGVSMVALQEVTGRIERIEERLGIAVPTDKPAEERPAA